MSERLTVIGAIVGAHGVRGEVRLKSFTEVPEAIKRYGPLVGLDGRVFEIVALKPAKVGFIAKLNGVDTRDAAESLKGVELMIPRERLPDDEEGFYHTDLVGVAAYDRAGELVGAVTGVHNYGAGDLIEIERPNASSVLIPFTGACVPDVDLDRRRITVDPPEGLLDE